MNRKSKWIKGVLTVAAVMGVAAMIVIGFPHIKAGPPLSRGHENDPSSRDPEYRADAAYHAELKKETVPVDTSHQLQNLPADWADLNYLCINGFVYVSVGHGLAPLLQDRPGYYVKCSEFK